MSKQFRIFDFDQIDKSKPTPRALQSGLVASPELVKNLALADGQTQAENLFQERVFEKTKLLTATIHRNKRQNFASEQACASSGTPMKVV